MNLEKDSQFFYLVLFLLLFEQTSQIAKEKYFLLLVVFLRAYVIPAKISHFR